MLKYKVHISCGKKKILFFFHSGGHKTNFKALFLDVYTGTYLLFFCICVSIYYPRAESKRYVVNKNTSFVSSGIGFLWPPKSKKILTAKILYD